MATTSANVSSLLFDLADYEIEGNVIDVTSKLSNQSLAPATEVLLNHVAAAFIIVVAGGYAWYLHKRAA